MILTKLSHIVVGVLMLPIPVHYLTLVFILSLHIMLQQSCHKMPFMDVR